MNQSIQNPRRVRYQRVVLCLVTLVFGVTVFESVSAQPSVTIARMKRCPDGAYRGSNGETATYVQDPYVWFVSRDFAKRFCLPDVHIDDQLKGALAIAVRIAPGPTDETICGRDRSSGAPVCIPPTKRLLMDVYLDNKIVKLPKADPSVDFYARRIESSGNFFTSNQPGERRRKGDIPEAVGERPPFNPYGAENIRRSTAFDYLGVRKGWASFEDDFIENYYKENWVPGVDLLTLEGHMGYGRLANPETGVRTRKMDDPDADNPIQRYAIGVIGRTNRPATNYNEDRKKLAYPEGYAHVIELPHLLVQFIYAYDQKAGEAFMAEMRQRYESNTGTTLKKTTENLKQGQ